MGSGALRGRNHSEIIFTWSDRTVAVGPRGRRAATAAAGDQPGPRVVVRGAPSGADLVASGQTALREYFKSLQVPAANNCYRNKHD